VRLQLRDALHLADVDHHGVFVDFGTPARFKYTLGNWRSGWGADVEEQGVTFTWATVSPARIYFHLDQAAPFRIMFRARKGDNTRISVYVNEQPITRVTLPDGWSEHQIEVAADKAHAGENSLKMVHSGGEGTEHSFAIDYLRIIAGAGAPVVGERFLAPSRESLVRPATAGGEERPAIALRAPSRMSYYLDLPREARLGFGVALAEGAQAIARVLVTPADSGRPQRVHEVALARTDEPGWRDALVDLSAHGGKIVRLDLAVESAGDGAEIAWANPSILTRRVRVAAGDAQIRNVIVLLVDTQRADALTTYRQSRVQSPQIERFARESVVFERCQTPANWTKPACASVLTGLHPLSHRALTESAALSSSSRLCSETFQAAGFQTAALIANGYLAAEFGFNQGWNLYRNYIREQLPTIAERVFGDALSWIEQNRSQRMFMYLQTIDPHVPYDPPAEDLRIYDPAPYEGPVVPRSTGNLLEEFKREQVQLAPRDRERLRALYDGEVTYHDRQFGRFIDRLRELGLLDSTLIVLTADHGEEFFEHQSVGHGHSLFQELLHVPLIVRLPGQAPEGRRLTQPASLVDIVPTVLEAAGIERSAEIEGRSLLSEVRGGASPVLAAAFSSAWDTGNSRETAWAARVGEWKLRMHGPANTYLYNLAADPQEQSDVDVESPIALRAARILLGQFLGAPNKGNWTAAAVAETTVARPQPQAEEAEMTPELCAQLRALGYMVNCE
jgi:arylsulfatase A-like enzyme